MGMLQMLVIAGGLSLFLTASAEHPVGREYAQSRAIAP